MHDYCIGSDHHLKMCHPVTTLLYLYSIWDHLLSPPSDPCKLLSIYYAACVFKMMIIGENPLGVSAYSAELSCSQKGSGRMQAQSCTGVAIYEKITILSPIKKTAKEKAGQCCNKTIINYLLNQSVRKIKCTCKLTKERGI